MKSKCSTTAQTRDNIQKLGDYSSHELEMSLCSFTDPTQWGAFGIFFDAE